jgi:hypothetical protein
MLRGLMPYLVKVLGTDPEAGFTLESGNGPAPAAIRKQRTE